MAKQTGLGMALWVGGYDLSGDIQALERIGGGISVLDMTDITQSAHDRAGGLRDGGIEMTEYFNADTARAHAVLSPLPTTDVLVQASIGASAAALAIGDPSAAVVAKQIGYDPSRSNAGELTLKTAAQANAYGLEWGRLLTAGKRTDTTGTSGTSLDLTDVSTAFGWQAYLQVFSVTGTSVTVTLEDSASSGSGFSALTGGAFTAVTPAAAPTWQRLAGGRTDTVRRYVRVTTSGTFSSAVFAVMFARNATAVAF